MTGRWFGWLELAVWQASIEIGGFIRKKRGIMRVLATDVVGCGRIEYMAEHSMLASRGKGGGGVGGLEATNAQYVLDLVAIDVVVVERRCCLAAPRGGSSSGIGCRHTFLRLAASKGGKIACSVCQLGLV